MKNITHHIVEYWEIIVSALMIMVGSAYATAIKYRKHREDGKPLCVKDRSAMWLSAMIAGIISHQAVLGLTDNVTLAGAAGSAGAIMGIEFLEKFAYAVLNFLRNKRD